MFLYYYVLSAPAEITSIASGAPGRLQKFKAWAPGEINSKKSESIQMRVVITVQEFVRNVSQAGLQDSNYIHS